MPFSFINWEKIWTSWSSCRSTCMICAFIAHASRKSHVFIHAHTRNAESEQCAHWVLAQLIYALLAGHKQYFWPASIPSNILLSRVCMNVRFYDPYCSHSFTFFVLSAKTNLKPVVILNGYDELLTRLVTLLYAPVQMGGGVCIEPCVQNGVVHIFTRPRYLLCRKRHRHNIGYSK